ncbi:MAG TPA: hypothetical protein VGL86_06410 [Polyangia bacterium]|jgi:hypothetical protein
MLATIVLFAQLASAPVPVQNAYKKLTSAEIDSHPVKPPPKDAKKIDVSARIRSASFGHKTWILIAPDGKEFWIENGPSTNKPGGTYGPFPVDSAAAATPPSGTTHAPIETPPPSSIPKK